MFFSFGPNEHPARLVASVIRGLLAGERVSCTDGEQVRDFMYVRDTARAFVAVLESKFHGDINIASGNSMTIRELVTQVAGKLDAGDRVDFAALARQPNDPPRITADISRLRDQVAWTSDRSIESAIDETIAWWKKQGIST